MVTSYHWYYDVSDTSCQTSYSCCSGPWLGRLGSGPRGDRFLLLGGVVDAWVEIYVLVLLFVVRYQWKFIRDYDVTSRSSVCTRKHTHEHHLVHTRYEKILLLITFLVT